MNPRKLCRRFKGIIRVHQRLRKGTGNLNPCPIIPTTALRAGELDKEKNLSFRVVGKEIIISKVPNA